MFRKQQVVLRIGSSAPNSLRVLAVLRRVLSSHGRSPHRRFDALRSRHHANDMRILYIDVDSLRPDHLGCYGYHRRTSPNIDEIASKGITLRNLYASDVPCLPSRTGFFGGEFGTKTGVINHGGVCADLPVEGHGRDFRAKRAENSLAALLTDAGYHTCSISPFPRRHSAYQILWGFRETFDSGKGGIDNADEVFEPACAWLERNGRRENWFLHVNFWDPHTPYDSPAAMGNAFADVPLDGWLTQAIIEAQRGSYGPHSAREVPGTSDKLPQNWLWGVGTIGNLNDAKAHIDGYDCGVHYVDRYIGFLCEKLSDLGVLDETAIVISADHGENLGELNVWGDHQTADEFTCHIPGILCWPGFTDLRRGENCESLAYHLDVAETILDLAGARMRKCDGQSLVPVIEGKAAAREELFLSQGAWSLQRAMRWDRWIHIHTVDTGQKDFPEHMLFDLTADRHETRNVFAGHTDLAMQAHGAIARWFAQGTALCPLGDPFDVVLGEGGPHHARVGSPDWQIYLRRLEETERGAHAKWLAENGGKPRPSGLSIFGANQG